MTVSDFQFKKDDFGNEFMMFAKVITKTRQSCLHEKHRLIRLKNFSTDTSGCPVNIFKLYLSKRIIYKLSFSLFFFSFFCIHNGDVKTCFRSSGAKTFSTDIIYSVKA